MASLGRHLHHFGFNTIGAWEVRAENWDPPAVSDDDAEEALQWHGAEADDVMAIGDKGFTKVK